MPSATGSTGRFIKGRRTNGPDDPLWHPATAGIWRNGYVLLPARLNGAPYNRAVPRPGHDRRRGERDLELRLARLFTSAMPHRADGGMSRPAGAGLAPGGAISVNRPAKLMAVGLAVAVAAVTGAQAVTVAAGDQGRSRAVPPMLPPLRPPELAEVRQAEAQQWQALSYHPRRQNALPSA
jgi:hypothetical protein